MARQDDYRVNEAGYSSSYSIQLDTIGLNLFGKTPIRGKYGPIGTEADGEGRSDRSLIFNDFSNGMGMAYSGVPNTYAFTHNMYMRGPRKAMPGGLLTEISLDGLGFTEAELAGEIRATAVMDWGSDVLIGAGRHILRLVNGSGDPIDEYDTGLDTQIDSALNYNNIPLFSTDDSFDNWQYLTGYNALTAQWETANSDGSVPGYSIQTGAATYSAYARPVYLQKMVDIFQEVDGVGGQRIVGNNTSFTYIQTQSSDFDSIIGDTSIYSASLECGSSSYGITGIYDTNRIFFITKADGAYGIEHSGIYCPNYVPDMKKDVHPDNGSAGIFLFGKLFISTPQGVLMVEVANKQTNDVPSYVNPSFYLANETPVFGLPTAYTTDNGWMVVALYNGTDSFICYARPREKTLATIPSPLIWHGSECTILGERITMLHKTSVSGDPQILVGTHDGTRMHLYTLSVPSEGDPYTDYLHAPGVHHQFARSGKLYLPFQDAEDPNAKKVIRRFDTQVDGLSLPVYDEDGHPTGELTQAGEISFFANADSGSRVFFETVDPGSSEPLDGLPDSEWIEQGVVSDSPKATMLPSLDAISGSQMGVLLSWELVNQGTEEVPVYSPFSIRSVKIRTDVYVEQLEEKTYTLALGHLQEGDNGARVQHDVQTKLTALTSLQDADAVYLIDEWRERLLVKVEPGMSYQFILEEAGQPPTVVVTLRVTLIGRQFFYDIGHTYDSVYAWGP